MRPFYTVYAAFVAAPALATFVVQCTSRLIDERIDPLVYPGQISDHVHAIAGGNGFDITMDYDKARASSCSTCNIKEDLSNYWTPKLYFQAQNGSFTQVPIDGDDSLGNMGGMAIYYLPRTGPNNDQLVPFPKGFRMFAGDPLKRQQTNDFAGQAVRHRCVGTDGETLNLPNKVCPLGVRTEIVFPSCWDGQNLDSADHKSHVAYPASGNFDNGPCPSSHPVHLLTLFYEVTYRTDQFQWYSDKQPFVFSNGDQTGYSFHGDFINGWDVGKLAQAIEQCPDSSHACDPNGGVFTFNTPGDRQACKLPQRVPEQVTGLMAQLPGCNPVSMQPVTVDNCPRNPELLSAGSVGFTDLSAKKGWKYLGCGVDDPQAWGARALTGNQQNIGQMTIEKCVDACSAAGYSYAGLEFASECYCGNQLDQRAAPKPGILGNCNMKCAGDNTENCGGAKAITLYQKCSGSSCINAGSNDGASTDPVSPAPPANPPSPSGSASPLPISSNNNEAVTGVPVSVSSTLMTVTKSAITSTPHQSSLHTRLRTTTITSVVTETYWS